MSDHIHFTTMTVEDTTGDSPTNNDDKADMGRMLDNNDLQGNISKGPPWYRSQRFILAYVLFGGSMNVFLQRSNFSIAIICMVNHTAISTDTVIATTTHNNINNISYIETTQIIDNQFNIGWNISQIGKGHSLTYDLLSSTNGSLVKHDQNSSTTSKVPYHTESCSALLPDEAREDGPYAWSKELQGLLLGAVYWTYMIFSFPSVFLVRLFSRKRLSVVSIAVMSGASMLIPTMASWSPWAVFAVKLVHGACSAISILSMYGMWTRWAPPEERTGLVAFCFSGSMIANAMVFPLSAMLCKYGFMGGWPSIFIVFGLVGFVWVILCCFLTAESPALHPRITVEERNYIESSLSHSATLAQPKVPWKALFMSPPVWAVICGHFSFQWGLFLLLSTLPQYMKEVLRFRIDSNGIYSMLPYLAMWFLTSIAGQGSNYAIRRKLLPLKSLRKLCHVIGNIIPAIFLVILSFLDCTQSGLAVCLLAAAIGFTGFNFSAFFVNPHDIAPLHAQAIITLSMTIGMVPGIITPYIVAAITKDKTREQWQIVFFLTAGVYVLGTVGYCALAKAEVQDWARTHRESTLIVGCVDNENNSIGREKEGKDERL